MHRVAIVLVGLAACFSKPPRPGADNDGPVPVDGPEAWLEGYKFRKRVTINSGIFGPLANFPIGVSVSDPDLAMHARGDGRDIVATEIDGTTLLATELAAYNAGALELWVRFPELTSTGAFYLYYKGDSMQPSTAVWDGPVFAGVWHLSDTGMARDSTAAANNLSAGPAQTPSGFAEGVFGTARELDGDDQLDGGDPGDELDFGTQSFSYSLWVHQSTVVGDFDTPFYKGGASNMESGYCLLLGGRNWTAKVTDSAMHTSDPEFGTAADFQNQWVHLAAVLDRGAGTFTVFANGQQKDQQQLSTTLVGNVSTTEHVQVGRGVQERFMGRLDEIRIYKTALTQEWMTAEHNNGLPGFLSFDLEEEDKR